MTDLTDEWSYRVEYAEVDGVKIPMCTMLSRAGELVAVMELEHAQEITAVMNGWISAKPDLPDSVTVRNAE